VTAKPNVRWVADITTLKLFRNQIAYVFLCIDIHTNYIIAYLISKKTITSQSIIRTLEKTINQRVSTLGDRKLIIHTDRGRQFSSKAYNMFTKKYNEYFVPSMSRENTPTDNSVAERFIRTFKEHNIYTMRKVPPKIDKKIIYFIIFINESLLITIITKRLF